MHTHMHYLQPAAQPCGSVDPALQRRIWFIPEGEKKNPPFIYFHINNDKKGSSTPFLIQLSIFKITKYYYNKQKIYIERRHFNPTSTVLRQELMHCLCHCGSVLKAIPCQRRREQQMSICLTLHLPRCGINCMMFRIFASQGPVIHLQGFLCPSRGQFSFYLKVCAPWISYTLLKWARRGGGRVTGHKSPGLV